MFKEKFESSVLQVKDMNNGPNEYLNNEEKLSKQLDAVTFNKRALLFPKNIKQPVQSVFFGWLNNKDLSSFSLSCHQAALWTKEHRDFRAGKALLDCVVKGNEEGARRILQGNPGLLLNNQCTAVDYSGKPIKGLTAFQAALCAGDVEMCLMMKETCSTLKNGQETLQEQYKKLFPDGIEAYSEEQAKNTFNFNDIITAILNAPDDEIQDALNKQFDDAKPLHKALSTFRAAFDKLSFNTQIFNPWHLHQAFTLYGEYFDAAQSWNKRDLIWRQVVGYTQRHLPACYAQSFAQGVYYLVEKKEPLSRLFDFRLGGGSMLIAGGGSDLGFDFAVVLASIAASARGTHAPLRASARLEQLFRAKTSILGQAFQPAEKPQLLVCSVMK